LSEAIVTGLAVAAVKGTRVHAVDQVELADHGALGNRAFYVIDERGRMVNGKQLGQLQAVQAFFDPAARELGLTFPDGRTVRGVVHCGEKVPTRFFSMEIWARRLEGPWADALSQFVGRPVRLVEAASAIDRGRRGSVSVISRASMRRLAEEAGRDEVDVRRFRMLIEVDGVGAHEEDRWVGQRVRLGAALVAMHGHVGRCLVTSRDPDSGKVTLPTLDLLGSYRGEVDSTEPLPFGVYGEVLAPSTVSIGDPVALEG
jgi:hypothetical protein